MGKADISLRIDLSDGGVVEVVKRELSLWKAIWELCRFWRNHGTGFNDFDTMTIQFKSVEEKFVKPQETEGTL